MKAMTKEEFEASLIELAHGFDEIDQLPPPLVVWDSLRDGAVKMRVIKPSAPAAHCYPIGSLPDIDVDHQVAFRAEFEAFIERTPPDCWCDSKALVSYGHEKGCGYMAWKARKAQP